MAETESTETSSFKENNGLKPDGLFRNAPAQDVERSCAAWTCYAGWGRLEPQGFPRARASGRTVGEVWGGSNCTHEPGHMCSIMRRFGMNDFNSWWYELVFSVDGKVRRNYSLIR